MYAHRPSMSENWGSKKETELHKFIKLYKDITLYLYKHTKGKNHWYEYSANRDIEANYAGILL